MGVSRYFATLCSCSHFKTLFHSFQHSQGSNTSCSRLRGCVCNEWRSKEEKGAARQQTLGLQKAQSRSSFRTLGTKIRRFYIFRALQKLLRRGESGGARRISMIFLNSGKNWCYHLKSCSTPPGRWTWNTSVTACGDERSFE